MLVGIGKCSVTYYINRFWKTDKYMFMKCLMQNETYLFVQKTEEYC